MTQPYLSANRECTAEPVPKFLEMHTHDFYELYLFYGGQANYHIEGTVYPLEPGDILIIKKAEAHSLWISQPVPYDRTVIHFNGDALLGNRKQQLLQFLDDRPLGKFNRYPAALFAKKHWCEYIENITDHNRDHAYMQIYLMTLLNELLEAYPTVQQNWQHRRNQTSDIISYINEHYTEQLSLESLCKIFYVSRTQLNRLFNSMTGVSVWKYVVTNRLLYAKELLEQGESPAVARVKCGFRDYSPFYRAYKAHFGVCPKAHKQGMIL